MTEIEAKFIIRRPEQVGDVLRVLTAHGFAVEDCGTAIHADWYFDTEDWSILAAGWACRIRRRDGDAELTLKSLHCPDGTVFVREEISQALPDEYAQPPFSLPSGPVQDRLGAIVDMQQLLELCRVTSERSVYRIAGAGPEPVRLRLDLDRSRIEAATATEKATGVLEFTELELELVAGDIADLESVAALLRTEAGLVPATFSKFERGLQAAGLEIDELLAEPGPESFREDDPVLMLLYDYLEKQLGIIRRQHPRALEGVDPEGVHQMRVASRRMRVMLKAFRDILGHDVVSRFNAELRWLARNLGHARDADVTERSARGAESAGTGHYERFLERETVNAYEQLVEVLQSERCTSLEHELAQFVAAGPTQAMQEGYGELSIKHGAEQFVRAALAKLLAHGDAIDADAPARQLHKLRIETKRFRYLLDFFSTVQTEKWLTVTDAVKTLQDVLGEHQDAVTAKTQLADYAATLSSDNGGSEELAAAAHLMQDAAERMTTSRQQFTAAWSDFKGVLAG